MYRSSVLTHLNYLILILYRYNNGILAPHNDRPGYKCVIFETIIYNIINVIIIILHNIQYIVGIRLCI
jgi:hypothetical protein